MFLLAFNAFLRISEITRSTMNKHNIQLQSVIFQLDPLTDNPTHCRIDMQSFKHNNHQVSTIILQRNNLNTIICPVLALWTYRQMRGTIPGALFAFPNGTAISRSYFNSHLQRALLWTGLDTHRYKSHSFRIGAATHKALLGFSDEEIRIMGRWHSNAFQKYIRIPILEL
ncbi:hypothetical protein SNE40_010785 [Patella caerulea]|uniref:Tyr recombinase domain-containing protein n=2 Tax=Patella caerulea TaxID=87958 RepID=A0AAN8JWN9_PATCE